MKTILLATVVAIAASRSVYGESSEEDRLRRVQAAKKQIAMAQQARSLGYTVSGAELFAVISDIEHGRLTLEELDVTEARLVALSRHERVGQLPLPTSHAAYTFAGARRLEEAKLALRSIERGAGLEAYESMVMIIAEAGLREEDIGLDEFALNDLYHQALLVEARRQFASFNATIDCDNAFDIIAAAQRLGPIPDITPEAAREAYQSCQRRVHPPPLDEATICWLPVNPPTTTDQTPKKESNSLISRLFASLP